MKKIIKILLLSCILCFMTVNVQASDYIDVTDPTEEDLIHSGAIIKTGTLDSTETTVTIIWPLDEKADFGYRIYVKVKDRYIKAGETGPEQNQFLLEKLRDKELKPGTSYTVKVEALSRKGRRTKVVGYRMIRTSTMPETTEIICAKRRKGIKAIVKWEALENISGYELQIKRNERRGFQTVDHYGKNKNQTILRRIKKKKAYQIRIRAYKTVTGGRIYGEWSPIYSI